MLNFCDKENFSSYSWKLNEKLRYIYKNPENIWILQFLKVLVFIFTQKITVRNKLHIFTFLMVCEIHWGNWKWVESEGFLRHFELTLYLQTCPTSQKNTIIFLETVLLPQSLRTAKLINNHYALYRQLILWGWNVNDCGQF